MTLTGTTSATGTGAAGGAAPAAPSASAAPFKASVLVVDDTPENRDLLSRRVVQMGHVTTMAENGARALELLRAQPFDLVLLDIMMPEMDGYQVLAAVKADAALRHIPVIVISALGEMESVVRCVELGAEDYLSKPFNTVLLRARVGASLEKKRLRDRERTHLAELQAEQAKSERLLRSTFPRAVADRLKSGATTIAESFPEATILFADIANFNEVSAAQGPADVVAVLNTIVSAFDRLAERHGVERIKTIGDTYMAAGGVPSPRPDHAEAVADLALAMQQEVVRLNASPREPLSLRIGVSSGPVVAGVIGTTRFAYDVWGPAVDLAAQMEALGVLGGIQVTSATYARLKDKYLFEDRGGFYVPGEGEVETYLLKGRRPGR